jgi:transposase
MKKSPASLTPEQQIKALQVELRAAQEKARLFEAVLEVLKKTTGFVSQKSLQASPLTSTR